MIIFIPGLARGIPGSAVIMVHGPVLQQEHHLIIAELIFQHRKGQLLHRFIAEQYKVMDIMELWVTM